MKRLLIVLLLVVLAPSQVFAQESDKETKLQRIDREIEEARGAKKTGMLMLAAGAGMQVLSFVAFNPIDDYKCDDLYDCHWEESGSAAAFWGFLVGGSVLEIWGIYKWWDGAQTMSQLKAKRYDISLVPVVDPQARGNMAVGLGLRLKF